MHAVELRGRCRSEPDAPDAEPGRRALPAGTSAPVVPPAAVAPPAPVVPSDTGRRATTTGDGPAGGVTGPPARSVAGGSGADPVSAWSRRAGVRRPSGPETVCEAVREAGEPSRSALGGSADSGAPRPPRARAPERWGPRSGSGLRCEAPSGTRWTVPCTPPSGPSGPSGGLGTPAVPSAWRWTTGSAGPGAELAADAGRGAGEDPAGGGAESSTARAAGRGHAAAAPSRRANSVRAGTFRSRSIRSDSTACRSAAT